MVDLDIKNLKTEFLNLINSNTDSNDENLCLITGCPLEENYVTLNCNHKFNYYNIYKEVCKQKCKINPLETQRLKFNQIKCPYCREVTNNLLPYIEGKNIEKIRGVNHPSVYSLSLFKCNYIYKSGKNKDCKCNMNAWNFNEKNGWLCKKHNSLIIKNQEKVNEKVEEEKYLKNNDELYKKYSKLTNQSLKLLLKDNNLKISGNKTSLIFRLINNNICINS